MECEFLLFGRSAPCTLHDSQTCVTPPLHESLTSRLCHEGELARSLYDSPWSGSMQRRTRDYSGDVHQTITPHSAGTIERPITTSNLFDGAPKNLGASAPSVKQSEVFTFGTYVKSLNQTSQKFGVAKSVATISVPQIRSSYHG